MHKVKDKNKKYNPKQAHRAYTRVHQNVRKIIPAKHAEADNTMLSKHRASEIDHDGCETPSLPICLAVGLPTTVMQWSRSSPPIRQEDKLHWSSFVEALILYNAGFIAELSGQLAGD